MLLRHLTSRSVDLSLGKKRSPWLGKTWICILMFVISQGLLMFANHSSLAICPESPRQSFAQMVLYPAENSNACVFATGFNAEQALTVPPLVLPIQCVERQCRSRATDRSTRTMCLYVVLYKGRMGLPCPYQGKGAPCILRNRSVYRMWRISLCCWWRVLVLLVGSCSLMRP